MEKKTPFLLFALFAFCLLVISCQGKESGTAQGRLEVVTTLFPLYDFARNVCGGRAEVSLLLPPGMEPHSYEPKPADVVRLSRAGVFVYTGPDMEPWAEDILKGTRNPGLQVIRADQGTHPGPKPPPRVSGQGARHREHDHATDASDPHIWLDFDNAMRMVDNIRDGLIRKDPAGREVYERNAQAYNEKLRDLDNRYRENLKGCRVRTIISGGHSAFSYLARRFGFDYVSVYGFSPDAEPTPGRLARVTRTLRATGSRHLFYEELIDPRVARTIASETGASLVRLHGAHNLTRDELERGETFIGLMNRNLEQLKIGLECP